MNFYDSGLCLIRRRGVCIQSGVKHVNHKAQMSREKPQREIRFEKSTTICGW